MGTEPEQVAVITGAGGMGIAVARRIGAGVTVLLADVDGERLDQEAGVLAAVGHRVETQLLDVGDPASVDALAGRAAALGRVTAVVHTAGLSPVQASVGAILRVDLLGTALVLDAFGGVVAPGGAGVVVASMAGSMAPVDPELDARLATTPTDELLALPDLQEEALGDPGIAYVFAKRANQVRVRAASLAWGARGARVNSISPGIIATAMGAAELAGPAGEGMRQMIAGSGTGRIGTPDDIAGAVAFLLGPDASFVTGTDLLVDGGVVGSMLGPIG